MQFNVQLTTCVRNKEKLLTVSRNNHHNALVWHNLSSALLVVCAIVISVSFAVAQSADTVQLKEVEVTAVRDTIDVRRSAIDRTVITESDIRSRAPYQLPDLLTTVPGLFMRQYGGLGGMSSVSVRGGSSSQALVMIDGLRLNTLQNGMQDLATVPLAFVHTIDVRKGALGAVDGANAMTGTVEMRLRVPDEPLRIEVMGGEFDTYKVQTQATFHTNSLHCGIAGDYFSTAGSFPYAFTSNGETVSINRSNAEATVVSGVLRLETNGQTSLTAIARYSDRGVPGAVVDDVVSQSFAALRETDVLCQGGMQLVRDGAHSVRGDGAIRYLHVHYRDPQPSFAGPAGVNAQYRTTEVTGGLSWMYSHDAYSHTVKVTAATSALNSTTFPTDLIDNANRNTLSVSYRVEYASDYIVIEGSSRGELYSDVANALAGGIGVAWLVNNSTTVRTHLGTGYRPPTFNELYYLNYGNRNLKPERSVMASVGLWHKPASWITADASLYWSAIQDLIVSVPVSPVLTSAFNIGSARTIGAEALVAATLMSDRLTLQYSYAIQHSTDETNRSGIHGSPVPYTPVELISASAEWKDEAPFFRLEWNYTGHRYAQPGGEPTSLLRPYQLLNCAIGTRIQGVSTTGAVQIRMDNVLNESYEVVRGYPMPGRMLKIVFEVSP